MANYQVQLKANDKFIITASGTTHKEVFSDLSSITEIFTAADKCGRRECNSTDVIPITRKPKGSKFTYYEMKCCKCGARFAFGQSDGDLLFPRRRYHEQHPDVKAGRAKEGDWLPNNGWEKYTPIVEDADDDTPRPRGKK